MTKIEILQKYDEAVSSFAAGLAAGLLDPDQERAHKEQYELFKAGRDALRRTAEDDKAREEGRLVVLPCKVGAFVFVSPNNGKSFHKAKLYGKNEKGSHLVQLCDDLLEEDEKHLVTAPMSKIFYDWFFTVYTRQEAEAVLSERGGEK